MNIIKPEETTWRHVGRATNADHPAFTPMRVACMEHKLPHRFASDVGVDRAALRKRTHDRPFAWLLYRDGSHMAWDTQLLKDMMRELGHADWTPHLYLWDGQTLRPTTHEEADQLLREWNDQQSAIQWRQERLP